jgi:hypothetical protein
LAGDTLVARAEHSQRDGPQVGSLALKLPGEQFSVGHGHILASA